MATITHARITPSCFAFRSAKPSPSPNRYIRTAELINGRSAMLGFTAGAGKLLLTGEPVLRQIQDPSQDLGAVLTIAAVAAGTFITLQDRLEMEEAPEPWTPENELLNGRVAMLGMLALAFTF